MNKVPVLEIFGPTIQGEGMVVGRKTMFVRTAGCDYSCAWCDSKFTWDGSAKEDINMMTADSVFQRLKELGDNQFDHVTISGGNPALLKSIDGLIEILHANEIEVALETQGSRWQDWFVKIDDLTISPKPPSSKMKTDWSVLDDIFEQLKEHQRLNHTSLKIVVFDQEDLHFAEELHQRYPAIAFYLQVGNEDVEEAGTDQIASRLLNSYQWLIDQVMSNGRLNRVHVLPQLHTLVWGNKRGV
ncbi:7-carboxy-7-deazaguanine synthase QueE [Gracilibacillus caseinilyticus]|uniref:7-carboxy-7-deazaguanine synthase n=1 Tax=Gracilibacillus caseinilyticus TaxID=2932256 RepID=A0ABY4ES50_9BACI|nr:7-carboxy-7-deazaguanine synthase QueE [Gracilibacillus caseinilyticus]UOQ47008.1 7-carboxy-7-deazaguanine synthase QueE [Gracilibacillus caseinilyticus]